MLCKVLIFLAVGLNVLVAKEIIPLEPVVHKIPGGRQLEEYTLTMEVDDIEPFTEDCLWEVMSNPSSLDERVFRPANAITKDGKGYCVLVIDDFPAAFNGKVLKLNYHGTTQFAKIYKETYDREILLFVLVPAATVMLLLSCCLIYRIILYKAVYSFKK